MSTSARQTEGYNADRDRATPDSTVELRPGQPAALADITQARETGVERGFLYMATGTGKTHVAAHDVCRFLGTNPDARVLYLCHQNEILRQAHATFAEVLSQQSHGHIFGGNIEDREQITYASFQMMRSQFADGQLYEAFGPEDFDYVIVDESHHGPASTYRRIIEHFNPRFLLGLTATPERRDRQNIGEIFGQELHGLPLEKAIARGYVARVDYQVLTDHVRRLEEIEIDSDNMTLEELNKAVFVPKRDEEIVATIAERLSAIEQPRTVVFCPSIAYAEQLTPHMSGRAVPIHSKLPEPLRQERLAQFRSGEVETVLTIDMFNEGVDFPEANAVVFLRSTQSQTVFLQQLGRGLRRIPGKEQVLVLDFVATWERINTIRRLESAVGGEYERVRQSRLASPGRSFHFDFSREVQDAFEAIETVRARAAKKVPELPRPERPSYEEQVKELMGLTHLPQQGVRQAEFRRLTEQIVRGDQSAVEELFLKRLTAVLKAAEHYPEVHGLTLEDHFQNGCEGLLEGIVSISAKKQPSLIMLVHANIKRGVRRAKLMKSEDWDGLSSSDPVIESMDSIAKLTAATPDLAESPEEVAERKALERVLQELLEPLEHRERRVLELHYGLGAEASKTYEEIGKAFGVTTERIRQIESESIRRLLGLGEFKLPKLRSVVHGFSDHRTPRVSSEAANRVPGLFHLARSVGFEVGNPKYQEDNEVTAALLRLLPWAPPHKKEQHNSDD